MASIALPPFLEKLKKISQSTDPAIAGWSEDGTRYEIYSNRFEKEILKLHFRGNRQTFIRQLHFYCFKKLDNKGEKWAFSHPKFQRDTPHLIYEIKRKTRTDNGGPASKVEVQSLRAELDTIKKSVRAEVDELKQQIALLKAKLDENICSSCEEHNKRKRSSTDFEAKPSVCSIDDESHQSAKKLKDLDSWSDGFSCDGLTFELPLADNQTKELLDSSFIF